MTSKPEWFAMAKKAGDKSTLIPEIPRGERPPSSGLSLYGQGVAEGIRYMAERLKLASEAAEKRARLIEDTADIKLRRGASPTSNDDRIIEIAEELARHRPEILAGRLKSFIHEVGVRCKDQRVELPGRTKLYQLLGAVYKRLRPPL
jgi:hypothetical protein